MAGPFLHPGAELLITAPAPRALPPSSQESRRELGEGDYLPHLQGVTQEARNPTQPPGGGDTHRALLPLSPSKALS